MKRRGRVYLSVPASDSSGYESSRGCRSSRIIYIVPVLVPERRFVALVMNLREDSNLKVSNSKPLNMPASPSMAHINSIMHMKSP